MQLPDGRSMPMEVKLLQMAQGTAGVIEILDYFERSDSYLIIMERPSEVVADRYFALRLSAFFIGREFGFLRTKRRTV